MWCLVEITRNSFPGPWTRCELVKILKWDSFFVFILNFKLKQGKLITKRNIFEIVSDINCTFVGGYKFKEDFETVNIALKTDPKSFLRYFVVSNDPSIINAKIITVFDTLSPTENDTLNNLILNHFKIKIP